MNELSLISLLYAKRVSQPKLKGLKKELESILKRDFLGVVEQYGLKGGDELPDVLANRIIHELFGNCARSTYLLWLEENWEEIDEGSPFTAVDLSKAYTKLEKQYAKDGVELDAEALVHELKRGLNHILLTSLTKPSGGKVLSLPTAGSSEQADLARYLPLLHILERNKERLLDLLIQTCVVLMISKLVYNMIQKGVILMALERSKVQVNIPDEFVSIKLYDGTLERAGE